MLTVGYGVVGGECRREWSWPEWKELPSRCMTERGWCTSCYFRPFGPITSDTWGGQGDMDELRTEANVIRTRV